jgi:2-dehydro-3-deoxyphosphogluconate aldolase / (4S)-4-hydroxy-2-oxoglutarate aldolase
MLKQDVLSRCREIGVLPVLRAESEDQALALASAVAEGGVTVIEVTMTVPGAIRVMRRLAEQRPNILIGAGTVLDPETARACILEGAQFIVSPALNVKTIEMCHRYGIAVVPGALTPTEIVTAWQAGADVVKVFPATALGGAKYLKSVKAPLPQVELIPTGGVSHATAQEFLEAGAFALGVGADLVDPKAIATGNPQRITESAKKYLEIVQSFRSKKPTEFDPVATLSYGVNGLPL